MKPEIERFVNRYNEMYKDWQEDSDVVKDKNRDEYREEDSDDDREDDRDEDPAKGKQILYGLVDQWTWLWHGKLYDHPFLIHQLEAVQ